MLRSFPCVALVVLSLLLGACREQQVASYRVPKEQEAAPQVTKAASTNAGGSAAANAAGSGAAAPAASAPAAAPAMPPAAPMQMPPGSAMAALPGAPTPGGDLSWTAPAHWQSKPPSAMRKATYAIPGDGGTAADLSISILSGAAGGDVANINRWRGQVQLPPLPDAEVLASITRVEYNGLKIGIVDLANTTMSPSTRVLGAIVPHGSTTWFFKVTGPDALVAKEKTAFLKFLETLRPAQ